jgi:hypothetical protein
MHNLSLTKTIQRSLVPAALLVFSHVDQTCNDTAMNSVHGHCVENGRCVCKSGSSLAASGKCR